MNNRIRTYHDRDITVHRNIRKYLWNIQVLYISLITYFTQLVKFYILVFFIRKTHMFISIFDILIIFFRIDMERAKTPFQDFIAAEISIESEDTVDCQARKKLFNWRLLTFISHKMQ